MSAKKFMNEPSAVVDEALRGFVATHPGVSLLAEHRVVYRSDVDQIKDRQVAVVCGGGSGHEPAHVGYVGKGMLSAAVCGDVFASPTARQVHAAIRACGGKAGVLLVIKCYTGDRLNFTVAAERARAEGIPVEIVVISEDEAIAGHAKTIAGRRGLCGTILAYKIAGALAETGATLAEVTEACGKAAGQMGSLNVALGPCCAPGQKPSFDMPAGDMELGLGIHGEAGCRRTALQKAKPLVEGMVDLMLSSDADRNYLTLSKGDKVALMVNNLGATTGLEQSIIANEALKALESKQVAVERVYVGTFMTALDMPGISLTLLKTDSALVDLLDAPTEACGWPSYAAKHTPSLSAVVSAPTAEVPTGAAASVGTPLPSFKTALLSACKAIDQAEAELTAYDKIVGDGDCGTTLQKGALAVLSAVDSNTLDMSSAAKGFKGISNILEDRVGGTSGALYCIALEAAAAAMQNKDASDPASWHGALEAGTTAIMQIGAKKGDRTMVDALLPACESLATAKPVTRAAFDAAVKAAEEGAQATAIMTAGAGRSTYVNEGIYSGTPDPGAVAVAIWLKAAVQSL